MASTVIGTRQIRPVRFWDSTNGQKAVMAATGVVLFLFVIFHMIGNLQVFEGREQLNFYGFALRRFPEVLWAARIVLLLAVALHIWSSVKLAVRKTSARPVAYAKRQNTHSSYASRTMYWSGPIILAFLIFHLLHLTAGYIHPGSRFIEGDVYHNLVAGFQVWWVSIWYIFCMLLLGLHIRHGAWSMFQSIGLNHPRHTPVLQKAAAALAVVIVAGYISIPLSVMLGLVK
ncbi:MAG TPA: succinate dehydrogenase cytochrome b subunit [Bryobacteraceae bacterium]|jgi:succinate dehydrogenase / fumarate reductase cytochrome b subunit|nr:succinate dehydrogenase cytochrome b subunit [Bryobacteraceae bacterium]